VNPAAEDILGIRSADIVGRIYSDAFSFIELDPLRNLFRRLEQGKGRAEEVIPLTVRGRTLTLRLRVSTLREGAGGTMLVITFQNLTELLRAQKAMTWQDVARKIAHEVKNPLTPIKLSAERLRKKFGEGAPDFPAVFDEASRTIIHEVDGLKRLLDEFSDFARMPRSTPAPRPLGPVVDEVTQLYAAHRGVTIARDMPADLPDVLIDAEQMKRVFINIFANAVDVMNGAGTITVSARLNGEGSVRVIVSDDGPGIAPEDLPHVFEPYFSRKSKGSGLGLAIVERIIADHDGTVHAEQNTPRGARFVIELPVAESRGK
jgi:two-component system nitrogen regulation sensor histidine kinase NtrY